MVEGGKLYIVPTPVGNIGDMTPRAIDVLKECDVIFAEDTRTSGLLMNRLGIDTPLASFHKFNEHDEVDRVMEMLHAGKRVALVSDAGTPGISDPGFILSRACRTEGLPIETLPGATAFVPALVDSGLPCERFCFEGFLPQKKGRMSRLVALAEEERTSIIYESPLRLVRTLENLLEVCGEDRDASVSREISKLHEETVRGNLSELINHFNENPAKGEIVIVLSGKEKIKKVHKNKFKDE